MRTAEVLLGWGFRRTSGERATRAPKSDEDMLVAELLEVERRSQEQVAWLFAVTILAMVLLAEHVLSGVNPDHAFVVRSVGIVLFFFFAGTAFLIRRRKYAPWFKYAGAVVQVSMVTSVIVIDAEMRGPLYAMSSMPPLFYGLVIGASSLSISPALCLATGLLASAQFTGLYAFYLRPLAIAKHLESDPVVGWEITLMKSVIFVAIGAAAMLMAKKARALLARAVADARAEEKLRAVENEMVLAAEIQAKLIPSELPERADLEISSSYQPARNLGGDYFDCIVRPNGRMLVVIADVSGKGYPAALMMSNVQAMVRVLAKESVTLDRTAERLNEAVVATSVRGRFVTMALVEIDEVEGAARFVNAGHNPPLVRMPDGRIVWLEDGGPVLGACSDVGYVCSKVPFPKDAVLVGYTDGLSEAKAPTGELFGVDRIVDVVAASKGSAAGVVGDLLERTRRHLAGGSPHDDLTIVCVRRSA